jgi:acyl-[acyl-carrier-protein]-phospholipid O-acyltransferase/long-chain-fatty-acid--[acyl-carrier-protein] ligase
VSAKIVDLDTEAERGVDDEGLLWIKGPNVMKGYLNNPEKTAEVLVDGWYNTGDMAKLDRDGFIHITGRVSRFSKIGGEMVPHIRVEEILQQFVGMDEEVGPSIAVTAVPDPKKGERLVVLHLPVEKSPADMVAHLRSQGLPNIYIPSEDSFAEIEAMPVLGTGKINLKGLKQMGLDRFQQEAAD